MLFFQAAFPSLVPSRCTATLILQGNKWHINKEYNSESLTHIQSVWEIQLWHVFF